MNESEFSINYGQLKSLALLGDGTILGGSTSITIKDNVLTIKDMVDGYETYITYFDNNTVSIEDNYSDVELIKRLVDVMVFYKESTSDTIFLEC